MSLINKMLRDIDARQLGGVDVAVSAQVVHTVAPMFDDSRRKHAIVIGLLTVAAAAVVACFVVLPSGRAPNDAVVRQHNPVATSAASPLVAVQVPVPAKPVEPPAAPAQAALPAQAQLLQNYDAAIVTKAVDASLARMFPDMASGSNTKLKAGMTHFVNAVPQAPGSGGASSTRAISPTDLASTSRSARPYNGVALTAVNAEKSGVTLDLPEKSLRLDSLMTESPQSVVADLVAKGMKDDAIHYGEENLARNPAQISLAMMLSRLQAEKGDIASAIATLERSLPMGGAERADYQASLGAMLQRTNQQSKAIEHYQVAVQKSPDSALWWLGLGISQQAMSQPKEALESFIAAKKGMGLSADVQAFVDSRIKGLER